MYGWTPIRNYCALSCPGVEDVADLVLAAVGELLAPKLQTQHLQELLALVGFEYLYTLPEDAALEVTVLPDQDIAAAGVLGEALGVVWLIAGGDVVTGGEVGGVQEAAGQAGAVIAPQVAIIQVSAQLLADVLGLAMCGQGTT